MYQFYYADSKETYVRKHCKENIRDRFRITAIRPAMWEEHCLECSAPECFASCAHYQERSDGRCKRFYNGLQTFHDKRACCGQGAHVKFRKWGNLMTVLFPAMLPEDEYTRLHQYNEVLGNRLGSVNNSSLPQALRWQGIRIPEYIRRTKLRRLKGRDNLADAFLFHGYSYNPEKYHLMIEIYDDHTPLFKTSVRIRPGENLSVITNLSPECSRAGNLVKIYPEKNLEAELDILWCDFVQGHPIREEKPAEQVKCLVWDLDNTLWDGILMETEDPSSIQLKPGVRETIEELDRRGILHSIASQNDHDTTWPVLEKLGLADYFLYPQINWDPKSGNIERIAKALNIGINSLAFIDDTAFQREEVRSAWPQVRIYDAPEAASLPARPEFTVMITEESRNRRKMYQAEARRIALQSSTHTNIVDFVRSCQLKMRLFTPTTAEELARCYELIIRTNQLNTSGVKYSQEEFDQVLAKPGHKVFAFSCEDIFGDYGIVGFGQYRVSGKTLIFTEFAMSCRVAGKFVGSALFAALLKQEGCSKGHFTVVKTRKNILLRNTLENIGFTVREKNAEKVHYTFNGNLLNRDIVQLSN
jgi:FkbH-like protein